MNKLKAFLLIVSSALIAALSPAFSGSALAQSPVYMVPAVPFQKEVAFAFTTGKFEAFGSFDVPTRKRLVIEHVSARIALPNGQKIIEARIETLQAGGGAAANHYLATVAEGSRPGVADYSSVSQEMRLYAVGAVRFGFFRTDKTGAGQVNATVSGYLVDL